MINDELQIFNEFHHTCISGSFHKDFDLKSISQSFNENESVGDCTVRKLRRSIFATAI